MPIAPMMDPEKKKSSEKEIQRGGLRRMDFDFDDKRSSSFLNVPGLQGRGV
jgi:hypothetical protein